MRLDYYVKRTCLNCRRDYETTDSNVKICPLCRADKLRIEKIEQEEQNK
jgi:Zn finger protein HypA/HybF involved in hydrogenase expression